MDVDDCEKWWTLARKHGFELDPANSSGGVNDLKQLLSIRTVPEDGESEKVEQGSVGVSSTSVTGRLGG